MIKKFVFLLLLLPAFAFAQNKHALVIGNGNYANIARLANPVNDANDMEAALRGLGFTVEKALNANLAQMENGIVNLKKKLKDSKNSYGFLFYAGHGVQSGGENYLIPVDANIQSESFLRRQSISVQEMLDELNDAGNDLNVVVLDACRDNPFGWGRGSSRGLAIVGKQPADSIVVYATSAGQQASDGAGRNGLFTSQLLKNIKMPGLEVGEVFKRTGADVTEASGRKQIPAIYNQFFKTAYLGIAPQAPAPAVFEVGAMSASVGRLEISTVSAGTLRISGGAVNQSVQMHEWGNLPIERINAGTYQLAMKYEDGKVEEKTVVVGRSETAKLDFTYQPAQPRPIPAPKAPKEAKAVDPQAARLRTLGASVGTSFAAPLVIGTVHGTLSPFKGSFFDIGLDLGGGMSEVAKQGGSGHLLVKKYFSVYPYANYAMFAPFAGGKGGWYGGAGFGLMVANYTFSLEGAISDATFAVNVATGFILLDMLDISYSMRTDFRSANHKLSAGYVYRF
jgi:hypothetical protein